MSLDYQTLDAMRQNHPAWRLLMSTHAALILSFLQQTFIAKNLRSIAQADLVEALEDQLFQLREILGNNAFPRSALNYLDEWAAPEKGWLRKFYRQDSDEVNYDLTVTTEKVITWLESLEKRSFVGTESRLLTLVELLRQLSEGSDTDPQTRLQELRKRRDAIDSEIAQVQRGELNLLNDTALKDRFIQFTQQAKELLSDFREVEHNFRQLDRRVRERIATWDGSKGELLTEIMGERDIIADSDQGASFHAFWDFLMSSNCQQEFTDRLNKVLTLPTLSELTPDLRISRIHYDWLEAGEYTQRTVAQLSQQLRRFLDDQTWLENRRIMEILHEIETKTLALNRVDADFNHPHLTMAINGFAASIELIMERPLFNPPIKPNLPNIKLLDGNENIDVSQLYSQRVVNKTAIERHIRQSLQSKSQISLAELCQLKPIEQGLSELMTYLSLGEKTNAQASFSMLVDERVNDVIEWSNNTEQKCRVHIPRIIFLR